MNFSHTELGGGGGGAAGVSCHTVPKLSILEIFCLTYMYVQ